MSMYAPGFTVDTAPDRRCAGEYPRIPLQPDPRISTARPQWLPADGWREHLDALTLPDCDWLAAQWRDAGGTDLPVVDVSWVTTEPADGHPSAIATVLGLIWIAAVVIAIVKLIVWWPW